MLPNDLKNFVAVQYGDQFQKIPPRTAIKALVCIFIWAAVFAGYAPAPGF